MPLESELYEFGPFRLDVGERSFFRTDGVQNGSLPEKAFQTLTVLVRNPGRLLTKQQLLSEVWPDSFVEENNLDKCIHAIRHALGEKGGEHKYIETVRKHGYRFVAQTTEFQRSSPTDSALEDLDVTTFLVQRFGEPSESLIESISVSLDLKKARDCRRVGEYAKSRGHAENGLQDFLRRGDRVGVAEAYRQIALSHFWEGNCVRSLEFFELGIKAIGDDSVPAMLCKIYTDMAGAFWYLRRPGDGIACLEKAVDLSDPNKPTPYAMIALNNLGIFLTLIGEWTKAEEALDAAFGLAENLNKNLSGILDSLAELKMLKGEHCDAQQLLERAVSTAKQQKHEISAVPAMRNLARCLLAQRKFKDAFAKADETIDVCQKIGETRYSNMALLVLAESCLYQGGLKECESYLRAIEKSDLTYYFFVLGSIQRIRGLAALEIGDRELAVQHFSRSRSIFEKASDVYHTALADYLIGSSLTPGRKELASIHLTSAADVFAKLGISSYTEAIAAKKKQLEKL